LLLLLLLLLLLFRYNILCSVLKAFSGPTDVCAFHHLVQSEKIRAFKGKKYFSEHVFSSKKSLCLDRRNSPDGISNQPHLGV